jgi:hypothetical protein
MMSWIVAAALGALQAPADAVEQDPDRPTYSLADLKLLREANVFSPYKKPGSRREEPKGTSTFTPRPPEPARPKPIQVTGFILDPATKTPRAILEDRNSESLRTLKEPLFAKAGDTAGGWTVEEVLADQITIIQGETKKTLKVGESFPEAGHAEATKAGTPTSGSPASATGVPPVATAGPDSKPLDEGAKNDILERLKQKNKKKRADDEP